MQIHAHLVAVWTAVFPVSKNRVSAIAFASAMETVASTTIGYVYHQTVCMLYYNVKNMYITIRPHYSLLLYICDNNEHY